MVMVRFVLIIIIYPGYNYVIQSIKLKEVLSALQPEFVSLRSSSSFNKGDGTQKVVCK